MINSGTAKTTTTLPLKSSQKVNKTGNKIDSKKPEKAATSKPKVSEPSQKQVEVKVSGKAKDVVNDNPEFTKGTELRLEVKIVLSLESYSE